MSVVRYSCFYVFSFGPKLAPNKICLAPNLRQTCAGSLLHFSKNERMKTDLAYFVLGVLTQLLTLSPAYLLAYLAAKRIIWLQYGIMGPDGPLPHLGRKNLRNDLRQSCAELAPKKMKTEWRYKIVFCSTRSYLAAQDRILQYKIVSCSTRWHSAVQDRIL